MNDVETQLVDCDSLLLLKMFYLLHLASESGSDPGFLMEHPADPALFPKYERAYMCASW